MNNQSDEPLLKVVHLKQFFKLDGQKLKAVHDVSFDIKKGEVFGLVGESGCGKTTTGRSIIKLYNATSGSVYFKGQRICAGTRWNEKEIKFSKIRSNAKINEYKKELKEKIKDIDSEYNSSDEKSQIIAEVKAKYDNLINEEKNKINEIVRVQTEKIKKAKYDHKNCDKEYAKKKVKEVKKEYLPKLENLDRESQEYKQIKKEYLLKLKIAKHERIITKIQMIFQDPIASLNPRMTVREIISEGLIIKGIKDKKYIEEKVYEVLRLVGLLPEHATRYPHEFSGGQRQRIGIARAIIMEPELIIADEPISALDVSIQAQVINLLNELREKMGLTVLFIAHDLSVVKYFCDRIAVMYFGEIVEMATSDELFKHPLHPYTQSLLSAIPLPDPHYEKTRKRIVYNPLHAHDYSKEQPTLKEVCPGHFVSCNTDEYKVYCERIKAE